MTIPTGHQTFTRQDDFKSRGELWKNAREGDVYLDSHGKHWECRGTFVKPAPTPSEVQQTIEAMKNARANGMADAIVYRGMWKGTWDWKRGRAFSPETKDWRTERGIPPVVIKYETSYTKSVVDLLSALTISTPRAKTAITAAVSLLKDYHKSLHAPYEQRDKARQDLVVAEAQLAAVQNKLRLLKVRFSNRMRLLVNMSTRWKKDLEV